MNLLLIIGIGFFLLLVGALLGRYYVPDRRPLKRAAEEGRAYVRGLVEALDGDAKAAIDEISKALRGNTDTLEAYFALGTLFRARKEYERAVRVHQALLLRRKLDKKTQLRVHRQLALDFEAAGFRRRAVKALEYVVARDKKNVKAFEELSRLYELTGDWERAAAVQKRLGKLDDRDTSELQAHLFAQLAQKQMDEGDTSAARKSMRRALSANSSSIHALHVLALLQRREGNGAAAVKAWQKALAQAPDLVAFFGHRLEETLYELGKTDEIDRIYDGLIETYPSNVHLRLAQARFDAKRNPRRALAALTALCEEQPRLLPARREAAKLVLQEGDADAIRAAFEELLSALDTIDRGYRCEDCGHAERDLFWQCTSCSSWGSVRVAWGRRAGENAAR
ncbi:MAG: hypothetical protein KC503_04530 [Myxococcales bacterium]|nr:hypothetical protein [Myxococcales bacterium]